MWVDLNVYRVMHVPCRRCGSLEGMHVMLLGVYYTALCDNCRTEFDIFTQGIGLIRELIIKNAAMAQQNDEEAKEKIMGWLFDNRTTFIQISSSFEAGTNGFPPPRNRFINTN